MKYKWIELIETIRCRSKVLFVFFISSGFFSPVLNWAQTYEETIDSLLIILEETVDLRQKVDRLNEISYAYRRVSLDKMQDYAQEALDLANHIEYKGGMAVAYKNIGNGYLKKGVSLDTIDYYYKKAIETAKFISDYYTQAASLNNLGLIASNQGSFNVAIKYLYEAIEIFDKHIEDESKISLKCLMLANLGNAYAGLTNYEKARIHLERALNLAKEKEVKFILSQYQDDLAKTLAKLKEYDNAEKYYQQALKWQDEMGDYQSKVHTLLNYCELKKDLGAYEEAERLAIGAVETATLHKFPQLVIDGWNRLSEIARQMNDVDKAISRADSAKQKVKSIYNIKLEKDAEYNLAVAFALKGNYQKAFDHLQQFVILEDSIYKTEKLHTSKDIEAKFENRIIEQRLSFLEDKQNDQKRIIQLLWGLIFSSIVSLFVISYLLYKRNQSNKIIQTKNKVLEKYIEYNLQLENFAYIASHDLKTPLRNVISFSQLLSRKIKEKLSTEEKEYFNFIISGSKEMSSLIDDLLNYSVIQKEKLNLGPIKVDSLLKNIIQRNQILIQEENAEVQIHTSTESIFGDPIKISQLLQNLLSNALKFHKPAESPKVVINCDEKEKEYFFEIRDNGIGIEKQYYERVFMIFKRLHTKKDYEGTGIGLAICKKIVEQHGGKIWIESRPNQGTSFFFTLPKQMAFNRN